MLKFPPHLCIKKFKWSWRPRLYIHYIMPGMGERYIGIFRHDGDLHPGINGCERNKLTYEYKRQSIKDGSLEG